jgi:hypothetical protein
MGQDGDGHAHFDQIWRPNITINYMGEHRGKTSAHAPNYENMAGNLNINF